MKPILTIEWTMERRDGEIRKAKVWMLTIPVWFWWWRPRPLGDENLRLRDSDPAQ